MKNILVPIDFNEDSANALKYAFQCYSNDKIYIYIYVMYTAAFTLVRETISRLDRLKTK